MSVCGTIYFDLGCKCLGQSPGWTASQKKIKQKEETNIIESHSWSNEFSENVPMHFPGH